MVAAVVAGRFADHGDLEGAMPVRPATKKIHC
jgi:hypothetical protein